MQAIESLKDMEKLLSLEEAAKLFGVSVSTLYKKTGPKSPKNEKLKTFKIFGKIYIHEDNLVDYINKHAS